MTSDRELFEAAMRATFERYGWDESSIASALAKQYDGRYVRTSTTYQYEGFQAARRAQGADKLHDAITPEQGEVEKNAARLWIDTEFNEFRGELISIAIVDEDGREFYEVLPPPLAGYGPWVAEHVVPILNKPAIQKAELQARLHAFLSRYPCAHIIADWPEDIEHFLRLLIVGPGERIGPDRWTMEVRRDLPNTADTSHIPHNALEDAKSLRACHLLIEAAVKTAANLRDCNDKDPLGCWNVRCQLGKKCCRAAIGGSHG